MLFNNTNEYSRDCKITKIILFIWNTKICHKLNWLKYDGNHDMLTKLFGSTSFVQTLKIMVDCMPRKFYNTINNQISLWNLFWIWGRETKDIWMLKWLETMILHYLYCSSIAQFLILTIVTFYILMLLKVIFCFLSWNVSCLHSQKLISTNCNHIGNMFILVFLNFLL